MLRRLLAAFVTLCAALVFLGFGASVHRAADSISLLRPVLGALCIVGCLIPQSMLVRGFVVLAGVLAVWTVAPPLLANAEGGEMRVYSKNLGVRNREVDALVADIRDVRPDVVMLQEVSPQNAALLQLLARDYPEQHVCAFGPVIRIAVLSRHPFADAGLCTELRAVAAVPVFFREEVIWVASLHIHWPWPARTEAHEAEAEALLGALPGPVVVAGDFNMMPWTARVRRIVEAVDGQLAGPVRPTLTFMGVPLPIDMVIAPGGGTVERRPLLGSDHAGIVAEIRLAP